MQRHVALEITIHLRAHFLMQRITFNSGQQQRGIQKMQSVQYPCAAASDVIGAHHTR